MMEKCYDIGTIQAFLDGELSVDLSQKVTRHIALCDGCAASLAEAEEETAFAFSALEREFDTLVPTHRLWTKINDSIVEEKSHSSVWQRLLASVSVLIANPSMTVAAGVLIVFGIFAVVLNMQNGAGNDDIAAVENQPNLKVAAPINSNNQGKQTEPVDVVAPSNAPTFAIASNESKKENQSVRVYLAAERDNPRQNSIKNTTSNDRKENVQSQPSPLPANFVPEYLPGEESYVKTIANLSETVETQKDEVLRPAARISFERDLAVVSDAISKMKKEVRKNPKSESANQVLYSSYQNKIDLLSSVAERTELMASHK